VVGKIKTMKVKLLHHPTIFSNANGTLKCQNKKHMRFQSLEQTPSSDSFEKSFSSINFKAHPDFVKYAKDYPITASNYFRRGPHYGSPSNDFKDIVYAFEEVFCGNDSSPKTMLVVGIGESQEPFSYLATIKDIVKDKKLSDTLDLNIVDLQTKPSHKKLIEQSYFDYPGVPWFAQDSFVQVDLKKYNNELNFLRNKYRVNDEIFDYLEKTYDDPKKSKWETPVQEAIKNYPSNSFDVISINNTFGYIEDREIVKDVLKHVLRILKPSGVFITDPYRTDYRKDSGILEHMIKIRDGIYQKID